MFEPLREILPEDPQALLDDARVLGEKAGRFYGSRDMADYAAIGGAVYQRLACTNPGVVEWGTANDMATDAEANGGSWFTSTNVSAGAVSSSPSLVSSLLSWLGMVPEEAQKPQHHSPRLSLHTRRTRRSDAVTLRQLLATAPHLLPLVLFKLVKAAAFVVPSVRGLCPSAVPDVRRLLEARQSGGSGRGRGRATERVTALSFHPLYLWLAVAVADGAAGSSTRILLYDVQAESVMGVLTHAFQAEVHWLRWKPFAQHVLAVGCRGGVLLWTLPALNAEKEGRKNLGSLGGEGSAPHKASSSALSSRAERNARALFYRTQHGFTMTGGAFSNRDGAILACASMMDTRLCLLNLREPPFSPQASMAVVVPTVDGGLQDVLFEDDDLYLVCPVCEHSSLALIRYASSFSSFSSASSSVDAAAFQTTRVATPAPVHCLTRATGLGPSLFFLSTKGLEGVLLARINPSLGVEVVAMISTGLYRGVGGAVTRFACSRRRLWVQTETNHLVVCRYGMVDGNVSVIPIGVVALEAVELTNFDGCASGSLVAALEVDGGVSFIPSYHS